jgi:site-specific recombinase
MPDGANRYETVRSEPGSILRPLLRAVGLGDPHQDLPSVLAAADRATDPAARVLAFAQLMAWIRGSSFSPIGGGTNSALIRFRFLMQLMERHPGPRKAVGGLVATILRDAESPSLFAQTELNEQGGLFSEILRRLGDQVLPPPPLPHELAYAARVAFVGSRDAEWLAAISENDWLRFCEFLDMEDGVRLDASGLENDLRDAVINISLQAAAIGLSEEVRARVPSATPSATASGSGGPFVALSRMASRWRDSLAEADAALLRASVDDCHAAIVGAYAAVETRGVSLSLVYRLENISSLLRRLELLLNALEEGLPAREKRLRAREVLLAIVRSRLARRSVAALFDMNFDIFARRLVQHAGETGEHYIARDRSEFMQMLASGIGGGAVTVATTFLKFGIYSLRLSPFFEGCFIWGNYSASFMAIQALGFSLATKQPSMTSAALADKLSRRMDPSQIDRFVDEIACISRSQFIAAVGNVGFVVPAALATEMAYEKAAGHTAISLAQAEHALESLHPLHSGSLMFAALTGVLLWLSSFGAGLLQNWTIYRGLPEAIGQHRFARALLGERRAKDLGRWVGRSASGIGGNLAIGFLLAFVPVAGKFFGLPLDIRHVTLSSGQLAVALRVIGFTALGWKTIAIYALGVALIGVLNFSVSTACALAVAARARRVRRAWFRAVIGYAWRSFFRNPVPFFWPPLEAGPEAAAPPHSRGE